MAETAAGGAGSRGDGIFESPQRKKEAAAVNIFSRPRVFTRPKA